MLLAHLNVSDVARKCEAFPKAFEREAEAALDAAGEEVLTSIRGGEHWKVRSGNTGDSFRMLDAGHFARSIQSSSKVALFLEAGTLPHVIRPKAGHGTVGPLQRGQSRRSRTDIGTHRVALRWYVGGTAHFARVVHHPGTKARRYLEIEAARLDVGILPALGARLVSTTVQASGWS